MASCARSLIVTAEAKAKLEAWREKEKARKRKSRDAQKRAAEAAQQSKEAGSELAADFLSRGTCGLRAREALRANLETLLKHPATDEAGSAL